MTAAACSPVLAVICPGCHKVQTMVMRASQIERAGFLRRHATAEAWDLSKPVEWCQCGDLSGVQPLLPKHEK